MRASHIVYTGSVILAGACFGPERRNVLMLIADQKGEAWAAGGANGHPH